MNEGIIHEILFTLIREKNLENKEIEILLKNRDIGKKVVDEININKENGRKLSNKEIKDMIKRFVEEKEVKKMSSKGDNKDKYAGKDR